MRRLVTPGRMGAAALVFFALPSFVLAQTPLGGDSRLTYRFSVDYFVQTSTRQSFAFTDERFGDSETFLWERLRPKLTFGNERVTVVVEGQDTHSRGSEFATRKAWLDLLNAYVEVKRPSGWSFKVGRRQGDFDTITRLVRTPDFAAVVRSFDVAEVGWQRRKTDVRGFVFRTVDNLPDRFNTWKKGEYLWTAYVRQGVGAHSLQTYLTSRFNSDVTGESGILGDGAIHAWETQAAGPLPIAKLTYSIEHILERGHTSTDDVKAYALFGSLAMDVKERHDLELRYVRTSGDERRGDGVKGGYDTFYMAVGPLSPLGIMRGTNLHALSIGGTHAVYPRFTLGWRFHESRLTTPGDGWYSSRVIVRSDARSSRLGNEFDTQLTYAFSSRLSARVGYYRFMSGPYLKDTGSSGSPYEVRVQIFGTL